MHVALVANPGSGKGIPAREVAERLGDSVQTVGLGEALPDGVERVVVAGGDGSIGPCAEAAGRLGVPLAVIPVGTANDFARLHGIPFDLDEACALALRGTRTERLELARIDGRPFVNVASGGLAPEAAERAKPLKRTLGPVAYALGALAAGLTGDPFRCVARVDGETVFDDEAWQVIVASSGAFGGGAEVEEADPADGRLDLVAVPAGSRMALPARAAAMRRGDLAGQEDVVHRSGHAVELDVAPETPFNVDGEIVACERGTVRFEVEPGAFELVVAR